MLQAFIIINFVNSFRNKVKLTLKLFRPDHKLRLLNYQIDIKMRAKLYAFLLQAGQFLPRASDELR